MSWDFGGGGSGTQPSGGSGSWDAAPPPSPPTPSWDGSAPAPSGGGSAVSGAPVVWLAAGFAASVAAIVVHLVTDSHWAAVGGWLLAGPVTIALLAVFVRFDTERRAEPMYAETGLSSWGRRLVVVLALAGVVLSAWTIADAIARSNW